jgi:asparaginyl-tRNA synthetase
LQSEHERYLVKTFKCPVIFVWLSSKYQSILHAFERRRKTVRAMDIFFLNWRNCWGSQREERFDVLVEKMKALGIDEEELWWYWYPKIWFCTTLVLD